MITRLQIANFKCHKDTNLDLSNLTILTGVNASGKTSIIQSLLLLRQSYYKSVLLDDGLELNKPLCNIGIGDDALYKLAKEPIMEFELIYDKALYDFQFDVTKHHTASYIKKHHYTDIVNRENLGKLSLFNSNFQYIGAARWGGKSRFPLDTYSVEKLKQISSDNGQGELVGHFIHTYGGDTVVDYSGINEESTLMEQIIYWEGQISSKLTIDVIHSPDKQSFDITYGYEGIDNNKPIRNLKAENIGFGISYTLPVVTALLSAKPGALIIIENPEAHIHPNGQAQLALLIAKVAKRGVQVIIETHSDHIINGALVATVKKEISAEQLSVYYFDRDETNHTTIANKLEVTEGGHIRRPPKGFFDQIDIDLKLLTGF